jgi:hypothetical protein
VLGNPSPISGAGRPADETTGPADERSPLLPGVSELVGGPGGLLGFTPPGTPLAPTPSGDPGSATGLTAAQERSLLDYLLGGR